MCAPIIPTEISPVKTTEKVRAARKIVKKYRKREEKREMEKLRKLLPRGNQLKSKQVIDETISLIVALEQKLLEKISKQGHVPHILSRTGLQHNDVSLDKLREAMAHIIPCKPVPSLPLHHNFL